MQQAVAQIRHQIVHYRKAALEMIFSIGTYVVDSDKQPPLPYNETIFRQCLANDKVKLPEYFAEQLKTGGVLDYYPMETLKAFLSSHRFALCRSVVPFAPGFKNVMSEGRNYQYANQRGFYDLGISWYIKKKEEAYEGDTDRYEARYFLMKLVYNNMFLPEFTGGDGALFRASVGEVLKKNEEYAKRKNPKAWAFKEVPCMKPDDTVATYMASVQSRLMMEENLKMEKEEKGGEEAKINFRKFLLQVFVKGFDSYLTAHAEMAFIMQPVLLEKTPSRNELKDDIQSVCGEAVSSAMIDENDSCHVAFYTFCKLLDAAHLSTLRNELIKYNSAAKTGTDNIGNIEQLQAIIELCLLGADVVEQQNVTIDKGEYKDYI
jgi:hypothetical protein